jgi:hypothetical protein
MFVTLLIIMTGCTSTRPTTQSQNSWRPLFNGNDLSGFYTFLQGSGKDQDPQRVFQVHDAMIHLYKDAEEGSKMPFGYFATSEELGDCRIRFQYKWGTKRFAPKATAVRDSGLLYFIYDEGPSGRVWPSSIECQVQESDTGDVFTINTTVSSTIDPAKSDPKAPTFLDAAKGGAAYTSPEQPLTRIVRNPMTEVEGWNTVQVLLRGDSAEHIVNGKLNNRVSNVTRHGGGPDRSLRKGRMAFQAEGAEVLFRKIEVQPLR